jgi:hypothetical protein
MELHFVIISPQSIICAHSCVADSTFVLPDCPFSCLWCVWWCPDTYWWCPNTLWVLLCTFWVVTKHFLMLLKHTLGPVVHILSGAQTHLGSVQTQFRSCYAHFGLVMGTTNITCPKMCITYNMGPKCVCAKDGLGQAQTKKKKENAVLLYCLYM